ncbi:6-phosphogluconolactonase [Mesorhizobium sp. J428]|uniref:6-phosphogluconolactonase n=1 Tax=Mesorhizobium sp. J428 TaxID=2898440 RepID=UPI002151A924|nr:6-phosphogluconolactonase [Mesorhizobium sp. J428]MCR5858407.1 6-phosphogluconolactonase [Mesorhizobium sp. J428]
MGSRKAWWRAFETRDALASALAATVADRLRAAIEAKDGATLAVSGGTTPALFFDALSRKELDWTKVVVTLVDERFVPPASERSNERLVREKLLRNEARLARFVGLYSDTATAEAAANGADAAVALLGPRLDAVVLGMGADGHTASFFPDAPNLDALTDPSQPRRVMSVDAPSGGEPRITLTLPLLVDAGLLALHIEGEAKKIVLERALAQAAPRLPIARVFDAAAAPIDIYWAP